MSMLQGTARRTAGFIGRESKLIRTLRPAYESFLEWSHEGKGISWTINDVAYRIDPHQRNRLGANYDAPVARFLRERIKPGAVCFDVGANVGVYVLQFAHWSGPTGNVVAFEPNPGALAILRKHVAMNDLNERVTIVPKAIGATAGEAILYAVEADGMSRLGSPNSTLSGRTSEITVPVTTIDEYCQTDKLSPDWLFIDIEGFEIAALSGARETLKRCGESLNIVVEMHPNVWDSAGTTHAQAEALLAELGLRPEPLTGQSEPLHDYGLVHLARL